ncbi:MAG: cupredoxin family copper-binding protein [Methanomicrobiales archaeon]|nr:cupredoxin family copper-binding protein [Methanomicrobiales archaeon]
MLIGLIIACGCTTQPSGPPATPTPTTAVPTTRETTPSPTTIPPTTQPTATQGGSASVTIQNFAFSPGNLAIAKGTTVTWTNQDAASHTVVSDASAPASFRSNSLGKGSSYSFVFTVPGTYRYHCGIHPSMTGTITVT